MGGFSTAVPPPFTGLSVTPPDPYANLRALAMQGQIAQQKQALAAGQQEMQTHAIQQQGLQMDLDQRRKLNEVIQQSYEQQPNGTMALNPDKVQQGLGAAGYGSAGMDWAKSFTAYQEAIENLRKTKEANVAAEADHAGRVGAIVHAAGDDPAMFHTLITDGIQRGVLNAQEYGPIDDIIQKSLQADPTGGRARQVTKTLADQLIAGSAKQQELINQGKTAQGALERGRAATENANREKATADLKAAAANLGATTDAAEYDAKLAKIDPALAAQFPPSKEVFDAAGKAIPAQLQKVRFLGMTPAEQNAAEKPGKPPTPTEAEWIQIANDPNSTPQQKAAATASLKQSREQKLAERPVNNINVGVPGFDPNKNVQLHGDEYLATLPREMQAIVKSISEGRQDMPSSFALTRPYWQQVMAAVNQYEPDFSVQRAQIRKAFTTGADGRNIGALNTATVHLDQLGEVARGLSNGSFRPGNQLWNTVQAMFGGAAPTNFEGLKTAVAGELASALKGNATDAEIRTISEGVQSKNSPDQLAGYIDTQLHVLGAKLNTYQQRYQQQIPNDTKWSPVLPAARSVYQKHGFDPTAQAPQGQAAPNGQLPHPANKAERDQLPVGTRYVDAEGNIATRR